MVGKSLVKNYCSVSLLSVVSKVFEKLKNFQYGFSPSRPTADLLTVAPDRVARAFNRSGATRAVALGIKAFGRV